MPCPNAKCRRDVVIADKAKREKRVRLVMYFKPATLRAFGPKGRWRAAVDLAVEDAARQRSSPAE